MAENAAVCTNATIGSLRISTANKVTKNLNWFTIFIKSNSVHIWRNIEQTGSGSRLYDGVSMNPILIEVQSDNRSSALKSKCAKTDVTPLGLRIGKFLNKHLVRSIFSAFKSTFDNVLLDVLLSSFLLWLALVSCLVCCFVIKDFVV